MNQPNIVLLTIDTLRQDMLGCYGKLPSVTPNIDRIASEGIRFDQAITGGSWTQAAFPVLMTSTYASMFGGCLGPLHPSRPSPVEALAAQGYATAGFSTSPLLSREYAYDRGFNHFVDLVPGEKDPRLRRIKGGQWLLRSPLVQGIADRFGRPMPPTRVYCSAEDVIDQVEAWLSSGSSPFFIWAHFMDTHWPYRGGEPTNDASQIAQSWRDLSSMYEATWKGLSLSTSDRARFTELYKAALSYVDGQIGRLSDYLARSNRQAETVVIIVSDHGEEFFEHGRWGHWEDNLFDEILRVPLILNKPDGPKNRVITEQVRTLDIMPTVLNLCRCSALELMEGQSLVPSWGSSNHEYDGSIAISEMKREGWHRVSVRTSDMKLIWDSRNPDETRLLNLRNGKLEEGDVSGEFPAEYGRLNSILAAHLQRVKSDASMAQARQPYLEQDTLHRLRDLGYIE